MVKNMMFYIFIYIFIVGCSSDGVGVCPNCYLSVGISDVQQDENGFYHVDFMQNYVQTFILIDAETGLSDKYQRVLWTSDSGIWYDGYFVEAVNGYSYTDLDGMAHTVLSIWEDFIGDTISVYSEYVDDCGINYEDLIRVIVDE